MLTPTYIWVILAIIFIMFVVSSIILISNIKQKSALKKTIYSKQTASKQTSKSSYWKVVKGHIKKATIDYRDHKTLFNSKGKQYRTRITYEYYAYDKTFNHTIALIDWTKDKNIAKHFLKKHAEGQTIVVRFDPKSPENSIIEPNR